MNIDIKKLLQLSVEFKASDLHITPLHPPILRIDGELVSQSELPMLATEHIKEMIYSLLTLEQQQIFEKTKELDFAVTIPDLAAFRVNIFQQLQGMSAVFRIIPPIIPNLDDLGTPPIFKDLLKLASGLLIIAGPTGCGKSTTLAAMLDYINNDQSRHIITIEDPIEFIHQSKKKLN